MTKQEAYAALVQARKECSRCKELTNPSQCCDGKHDSDEIGPWSLWQGNLNAAVMVIGQDWADEKTFVHDKGREDDTSPTNKTLMQLLAIIGVHINNPLAEKADSGIAFFTNAILCLKHGGMQAKVNDGCVTKCGKAFLLPLIQLIKPQIVVALGVAAYGCIQREYHLPSYKVFREVVEMPEGWMIMDDVRVFPRYHCGSGGINRNRSLDQQKDDWRRIRPFLHQH